MQFILQIFTGAYFARAAGATAEGIRRKLEDTLPLLDVSEVIVGWNTDEALQHAVLDCIHGHGKKAWLWLPVFSEAPHSERPDPQIGFSGAPHVRTDPADGEDFTFVCPSSPRNREIPLRIYDRFFKRLPYDGVFLDKIRQSSYAGGLERGIGCLCGRCRGRYAQAGVDVGGLLRRVRDNPALLLPTKREGAQYRFADPDVDRYHVAKAACITEAVSALAAAFRRRSLLVGLDVFAPLVAWYVGQDMPALAEAADFVKPMLYLRTDAPAGVPFELACLRGAMKTEVQAALHGLWGVAAEDATGCAMAQMAALAQGRCPIYPGLEINRVPGICHSDPDYVRGMARRYADAGAGKLVLSWNLLQDTGENLAALAREM